MRGYFAVNTISEDEKSNILSQHKTLYNGYQTMNPEIPNTQPLYVQDFAKDKVGAVMGNKGNIKGYTNMGINEQVEEQSFPYDKPIVSEGECSECGGTMMEGECSECGWKGDMDESECAECGNEMMEGECSECGGMMEEGVCNECGYGSMEEETGHLDDIYHEEDLDPNAEFDYVKGASNKTNAFHVKEQMMTTPIGKISSIGGMKEQGGNADDMDVDDVQPSYNFKSDGPMDGGDVYPVNEYDDEDMDIDNDEAHSYDTDGNFLGMSKLNGDMRTSDDDDAISFSDLIGADTDIESERDNLEQEGYEQMESAWADDIDEVDISGTQGVYGDVDPAYDFDSKGPNKGEMEEQYPKNHEYRKMLRKKDAVKKGEDFDDSELDISDYQDDFDSETSSWEDVSKITGDDEFGYVDEDIRESVIIQKNRIMEMMNRMKVIK